MASGEENLKTSELATSREKPGKHWEQPAVTVPDAHASRPQTTASNSLLVSPERSHTHSPAMITTVSTDLNARCRAAP
jgi:hypothetical protein